MGVGGWSTTFYGFGELPGLTGNSCSVVIPLHSPGLWNLEDKQGILSFALPRLQLQLAIIYLLTQALHILLFQHLNFQRVVAEIMAGIILGPTVMGKIPKFSETLFPKEGEIFLDALSKMGYIFFLFLIGVKMDPGMVKKTGRKAWAIGLVSVVAPLITSSISSTLLEQELRNYRETSARAVIGIQTITPFAVVAQLLIDLRIMNSELGRLALSSTLISDLVSTSFTTMLMVLRLIVASGWIYNYAWMQAPICMCCFLLLLFYGMRPLFPWIIKQTPQGKPVKSAYIVLIACVVLASAIIGDIIGLEYHIAPFLLGLAVPHGPPLGSTLVEKMETLVMGLFAPLMVSTCGLYFDLFTVYDIPFLQKIWMVFACSCFIKALSIIIPSLLAKMPLKDACLLSIIMSSQGIVELAYYMNYFMTETIDHETFAQGTLSVLLMDMITSRLVKSLYDYSRIYAGYRRRNIENLARNADLRILACAHRQDDALAVVRLLEVSNPTKQTPIVAYSVHLVELVGQTTPLIINHGLGQKASHNVSRSKDVIETFRQYGEQNAGIVNVQAFTAMSLTQFMQEDICYLAFDKLVSFIILPFHRKWNQQGKVIRDNSGIRTINQRVLEMAPCSVGILVDRRKIRNSHIEPSRPSVYRVVVIFLEGSDDREALSFAKRMVNSAGVQLSVIRLVTQDHSHEATWETIFDTELLNDTKRQYLDLDNNVFREETVTDGSDTTTIVRQLVEVYDLIITGRRHRKDLQMLSGLTEWMELPELGPIGDILASADIDKRVSVLIVQQQLANLRA